MDFDPQPSSFPKNDMQSYKSPQTGSSTQLAVEKDEVMRRKQAQELKRKQEIEDLKRKAREKEEARRLKIHSAIFIQRWVRGHLVRLNLKRQQLNFKYMRKFRRMMSVALGRRRKMLLRRLKTGMKEAGKFVLD